MVNSMVLPLNVSIKNSVPFLGKEDVHVWIFFNQDSVFDDYSDRLDALLADYLHIDQKEVSIQYDSVGKPYLPHHRWLSFNLSHSGRDLVVAVSKNRSVGVDVENLERNVKAEALAKRYFFPEEYAEVQSLDDRKQREVFLRFWVLKEAAVKAWGKGLAKDLRRTRCRFLHEGVWTIGDAEDACLGKVFAYEGRVIAVASLEKQGKFRVSFFMNHGLE